MEAQGLPAPDRHAAVPLGGHFFGKRKKHTKDTDKHRNRKTQVPQHPISKSFDVLGEGVLVIGFLHFSKQKVAPTIFFSVRFLIPSDFTM